jgi:hypothetical protein
MSDISSTVRTQEIQDRVRAQYAHASALGVQSPQAVFPEDRVELSSNAKQLVPSEATSDSTARFRQNVLAEGDDALKRMTTRLDRLMSVYGVNSTQTNISGQKVVETLRNELKRIVGTVKPPTIDTQVRQELNFIVKQMEIKKETQDIANGTDDSNAFGNSDANAKPGSDAADAEVSVTLGSVSLEWGPAGQSGSLLAEPGTLVSDSSGRTVDLSQASNGVFYADARSQTSASTDPTASALDQNAGRLAQPAAQQPQRSALPDLNQDGARNEADTSVSVVVARDTGSQSRQAAAGLAQFVADLAVPIAVRDASPTASRPQSFEDRD